MSLPKFKNRKTVLIVNTIDTEGPLYESLEAKFERIYELYKIDEIEATHENFKKLQHGEIDLGGVEKEIEATLAGHLVNYNETWDEMDAMLDRVMSTQFRYKMKDSAGNGWVFNWHCMDHINYDYNPRRRDIGYHNIYDHYFNRLKGSDRGKDAIHWHYHPMSTYKDAHRCATNYFSSDQIFQNISRKVIERNWFPTVFRAGFQTERPDSHWFLEQWIPFDISNMALDDNNELGNTVDFRNGRSGDWRLAPSDWSIYQPSHDNYQIQGDCRRWIARALNVMNRLASIDQKEMDKAFCKASKDDNPVIVGIAAHDFRDLGSEVDFIRELIAESQQKYPDVDFLYCEAIEAFQAAIWPDGKETDPLNFDVKFYPESDTDVPSIEVVTTKGKVFGPQPYLAIETKSRRFIHDNFDFSPDGDKWYYAFHTDTLPIEDIKCIGVAANDMYGNMCIRRYINKDNQLVEI